VKQRRARHIVLSMLLSVAVLNLMNVATHLQHRERLGAIGFLILLPLSVWLVLALRSEH